MLPCEESDVECTRQERTARARVAARGVRGLEVQRAEGRPFQVRDLAHMPRIWSSSCQISVGRILRRISYS